MRPATLPLAATLLALAAAQAHAADWSGLYFGVHGGQELLQLDAHPGTAGLGVHIGYGLQLSTIVLGVEADADRGAVTTSNVLSPTLYWDNKTNWTGTVRGRLGFAFDNLQVYGTGGVAYRNVTTTLNRFGTIDSTTASTPGLVYGAGAEFRILPKLDVRLEALHYDFSGQGPAWVNSPATAPAALGDATGDTVVRAGLSLRLN
jgi:outer membrane immunogenic protein